MDNYQGPYLEVSYTGRVLSSNQSFSDLNHELQDELIGACREVIESKEPKSLEKFSKQSLLELTVLPVSDEEGNISSAIATGLTRPPQRVFSLFQDVIFDNIPIVLFFAELKNHDYYFRAVNNAFLSATGLRKDQIIDRKVKDVLPKESHELVFGNYEKAIRQKSPLRWEEKSLFPAGVRYGEVTAIPVFDEKGDCNGIIGTVHDVTDRKITEIALEKNFFLLNSVFEGTTDAVFIKDLEGRYIMLNGSTAKFHGRPKEQILGHSDEELTVPNVAKLYSGNDQEVIRTGKARTFLEEGTLGGRFQCFLSLKAPYKNSEGKTIGIIGLSRDITELKESQDALKRKEDEIRRYAERMRLLYDLSVLLSRAQLQLEKICEIIVSFSARVIHGAAILELADDEGILGCRIMSEDLKHLDHFYRDLIERKTESTKAIEEDRMIIRTFDENSENFPYRQMFIFPLRSMEKMTGVLKLLGKESSYSDNETEFFKNLADRSALAIGNAQLFDKARNALQLREDFIQVASHELRTPLTPLKLQLGLLKKFLQKGILTPNEEGQRLLDSVHAADKQIHKLSRLIDDMIEVTKFNRNKMTINASKTDLQILIRETVAEFGSSHEGTTIELEFSDEHEINIRTDTNKFKNAFLKVLTNAVQYGEGKPIRICVERNMDMIDIKVRDFGLGISAKDQKRIFDRFERGLPADSFGGLGMGLYISRMIIESLKGKIAIKSAIGEGSTFTISLPL